MLALWVGTTTVVQLTELKNRDVATTEASVEVVSIVDRRTGAEINEDLFPLAMPWSADLELYEGALPHTLEITKGGGYTVTIKADDSGVIRTWALNVIAKAS